MRGCRVMGYRRYRRRTGASRLARGRRAYIRPYMRLEERVTSVDVVEFPKLERALRKGSIGMLLGGMGDLKLIHVGKVFEERYGRRVKRTTTVLDIVFDRDTLEVRHLGLKGVRGWNPDNPEMVNLPREYDLARNTKKR